MFYLKLLIHSLKKVIKYKLMRKVDLLFLVYRISLDSMIILRITLMSISLILDKEITHKVMKKGI
jgi:hypothetical protein